MVCVKSSRSHLAANDPQKSSNRTLAIKKKARKNKVTFDSCNKNIEISLPESSTWLPEKERTSIRREVELTLLLLGERSNAKMELPPSLCGRGLEDLCYTENVAVISMASCLKPEVIRRRRIMTSSLLKEQESQRLKNMYARQESSKLVEQELYDYEALRKACMTRNNRENTMVAIERALKDAEEARSIYTKTL